MDTIKDMFKNPQKYAKFWVALIAPAGALVFSCAPQELDGVAEGAFVITPTEWYNVLVSFAVAAGVYNVPNKKV